MPKAVDGQKTHGSKLTEENMDSASKKNALISSRWSGMVLCMLYEYEMDKNGSVRFPWCSDGIKEICEATPEEALNDGSIFFNRVRSEGFQELNAKINDSFKSLKPWNMQYRVSFTKAGLCRVKNEAIAERQEAGSFRWSGQIIDITEQKYFEERIIGGQQRNGKGKHELGYMLRNMWDSFHPTLRRKGMDLLCAKEGNKILATLNVSKAFKWLTKCIMSASTKTKAPFASKRKFLLQESVRAGCDYIEIVLEEAEKARRVEALVRPLGLDANGKRMARLDWGSLYIDGALQ